MENNAKIDEITISVKLPMSLHDFMEKLQTQILNLAFEKFNGNRSHAAKALGINRTTLISKAKRHGIIAETHLDNT